MTGPVELLRRPGAGAPGRVDDAEVAAALERVVDPCSQAQGTPLSLPAMGLVRGWSGSPEGVLTVDLCVTAPGCTFLGVFADATATELASLPGVAEVVVRLDAGVLWSERLLRADAADVLLAGRDAVRRRLPVVGAP